MESKRWNAGSGYSGIAATVPDAGRAIRAYKGKGTARADCVPQKPKGRTDYPIGSLNDLPYLSYFLEIYGYGKKYASL